MSSEADNAARNVVAAHLDNVSKREVTVWNNAIERNHTFSKVTAARLGSGPDSLEALLLSLTDGENAVMSIADVQEFLTEQRARLKSVAAKNVRNERAVGSLISVANELKSQVMNGSLKNENSENGINYVDVMQEMFESELQERSSNGLEMHQEVKYREICIELGESLNRKTKNKDDGDNEEDDDEVVMQGTSASQGNALKCPIMGVLMEDPVKNKFCKHVYSRSGILQMIKSQVRNKSCKCPFPGCSNTNVTESQLEDALEVQLQVRREKRRLDLEAQQRASQADLVDTDDEEDC